MASLIDTSHLMGHEGFMTVIEGPGVKHVQTGDSVVLHWRPGAEYVPNHLSTAGVGILNAGLVTTFNRHAVESENRCTKVPAIS